MANSGQLVHQQKSDGKSGGGTNGALIRGGPTQLPAPLMELSGHGSEVFATRFDPSGKQIATAGADNKILLWNVDDCRNTGTLLGHGNAVVDVHWSRDSATIHSASADASLASWDVEVQQRMRRYYGHSDMINSMTINRYGTTMMLSASDDKHIGIWDSRKKDAVGFVETEFSVTAVAWTDTGDQFFSGGIDDEIICWNMRKLSEEYRLQGHTDTITSLQISPDEQSLLSNSHDNTVRMWDIKAFVPITRLKKVFDGAVSDMQKELHKAVWDRTGERIAAGSADRTAVLWDVASGKLLSKLPGHRGSVNDVRFSPIDDRILLTGSNDGSVLLGELPM